MPSPHRALIDSLFRAYDETALGAFRGIRAESKADGTAVTLVDREVSRQVVEALRRHTPDFGIVSEEEARPYLPEAPCQWVIDPLDGTASFARGYPVWGLGIGLLENGVPREGYLRFPALGESYACDGEGFTLNGRPMAPLDPDVLGDTRNYLFDSSLHKQFSSYRPFRDHKLRVFGSNLYHMASLAAGRAEAMVCGRVYLWDLAGALPMTRARGFVERYVDGSPFDLAAVDAAAGYRIRTSLALAQPDRIDALLAALAEVL